MEKVAFTGHRELGEDFSFEKLKNEIKNTIEKGATTFLNGGAMGFDLYAGEAVLSLKEEFPFLKLIICIPCANQDKYFSDNDKKRYAKLLKEADEKIMVSDYYFKGCMQKRDRFMVDGADALITYCKKETGGTAYTVRYFEKKYPSRPIIFL